jgi:hypothetical protein
VEGSGISVRLLSDHLDRECFWATSDRGDKLVLHQYFLALFGMPIGELWDLKALAAKCAELRRWTFFLTSSPLNVPGSIASPYNHIPLLISEIDRRAPSDRVGSPQARSSDDEVNILNL